MRFKKALAAVAAAGFVVSAGLAAAQNLKFFRIGTGGTAGTYYPIGALISNAISHPPGSRACDKGGSCGVPGLIAIAQSSNGSVANINGIVSGSLESGFAQSDVAYWAYTGTGIFADTGSVAGLRAIANLYSESIHLVARKGAGIESVRDLRAKRVSLDEPGSGTLVDARIILEAYGLEENDIEADYMKPGRAIGKIKDGQLDAFFIVAGFPTASVAELASSVGADLVPIDGPEAEAIMTKFGFFAPDTIPAETYEGIGETKTLSVGAQWVIGAVVDAELVYAITKALWNRSAREVLDNSHPKGKMIRLETALNGVAIPLHPGAERFYREVGVLK